MKGWSYTLTRPYPGRCSTLGVVVFFTSLTVLLSFINVPLSAYSIQQTFTNTPNDTIAFAVPSFNLVPSLLRRNSGDFIPHTFALGESFQTNFSLFGPYIIKSAYSRSDTHGLCVPSAVNALSSFSYSNNNLRTCDISQISLDLGFTSNDALVAGWNGGKITISCWYPQFFTAELDLLRVLFYGPQYDALSVRHTAAGMLWDLNAVISNITSVTVPSGNLLTDGTFSYSGNISLTFQQCCTTCNDPNYTAGDQYGLNTLENYEIRVNSPFNSTLLYDHPCDDQDVSFKSSISFSPTLYHEDNLKDISSLSPGLDMAIAINNTLRAIYHAVRLDIRPNQIYNSPTRFNASITDLTLPSDRPSSAGAARSSRDAIGNVDLSNATYSLHVPDILYLTPVFKLKPLPQAITAVFVSTFSMLSVLWTVFNFLASSILMYLSSEHASYCACRLCSNIDPEYAKVPMQDDPILPGLILAQELDPNSLRNRKG